MVVAHAVVHARRVKTAPLAPRLIRRRVFFHLAKRGLSDAPLENTRSLGLVHCTEEHNGTTVLAGGRNYCL
jgi:hypothetical protein